MLKQKHEKVKAREMKNDNISGYNMEIEAVKFFSENGNFAPTFLYLSVILLSLLLNLLIYPFISKFNLYILLFKISFYI